MDYPFSAFKRHLEMWHDVRRLTEIFPKPEEPGGDRPIRIGNDMSVAGLNFRIMHMLSADGITGELRKYVGMRFFHMLRFIALHEAAFNKAGFVLLDDGTQQTAPNAVLRAVHETFRGEPLRKSDSEPIGPVIERALTYEGTWEYE
jgi:hypothetical protein